MALWAITSQVDDNLKRFTEEWNEKTKNEISQLEELQKAERVLYYSRGFEAEFSADPICKGLGKVRHYVSVIESDFTRYLHSIGVGKQCILYESQEPLTQDSILVYGEDIEYTIEPIFFVRTTNIGKEGVRKVGLDFLEESLRAKLDVRSEERVNVVKEQYKGYYKDGLDWGMQYKGVFQNQSSNLYEEFVAARESILKFKEATMPVLDTDLGGVRHVRVSVFLAWDVRQ